MKNKGITLIALIVSIIVLLILAGTSIQILVGSNGLLNQTFNAKNMMNKATVLEKIKLECLAIKNNQDMENKTSRYIFEIIENDLDLEDADFKIYSKCMHIITKEGWNYTIAYDLSIYEEIVIYLDIADGPIDLKAKGYVQNNQPLVKYNGKYIITGSTTDNYVRVMEEGTYNVILKNCLFTNI